jgi:drug/metabolite transporter (DMT)-like permease
MMDAGDYLKLVIYSVGMATGQVLFKTVAKRLVPGDGLMAVVLDPLFVAAGAFYLGLTFVWIWILTTLPLSRAYPLSFMSIIMVSIASKLFLGEQLNATYVAGLACAIFGLVLVAMS